MVIREYRCQSSSPDHSLDIRTVRLILQQVHCQEELSSRETVSVEIAKALEETRKQKEDLQQQVADLTALIDSDAQEMTLRKKELARKDEEAALLKGDYDAIVLKVQQLQSDLETYKSIAAQSEESAEKHVRDVTVQLQEQKEALLASESQVSSLEEEVSTLHERLHGLHALEPNGEVTVGDLSQIQKENREMEQQIAEKNKTIKQLQQRMAELKKTLQKELVAACVPICAAEETNRRYSPARRLPRNCRRVVPPADPLGFSRRLGLAAEAVATRGRAAHADGWLPERRVRDSPPLIAAPQTLCTGPLKLQARAQSLQRPAAGNPEASSGQRTSRRRTEEGKHRVTKRGPALSNPMFTLVTGIVGRWRVVCVTALQRPNSDAAAIRIVVGIAAASLSVTRLKPEAEEKLSPADPLLPSLTVTNNADLNDSREINFEYLKHVVLKFMSAREAEAFHLIKAVSVLLNFSVEEENLLKETLEYKMSWFGSKPAPKGTVRPSISKPRTPWS
ncbi:unnamed protein product [Ranitomeya imitator]|uniref:GRIP domain-containing protein n=1 Tax=Ranitomeya imitator TaxID=111125 RepID=A0ABN9MI32_9NEOB|nr:unnamed protein product [Ranitomeya imitator]